jgi:pimeloyl-ACP methyl ester carboxylesterase
VTKDVVLLPSLGRPASDFTDLVARLTAADFTCWPLDPLATVPVGSTLFDLARDTMGRLDDAGVTSAHLIGHAFGNRLARAVATIAPDRVSSLTLLAAGGHVPIPPAIGRALALCFALSPGSPEQLDAVRTAFFAPGHDPTTWADGWNAVVAEYQRAAVLAVEPSEWWDAVAPRVLVVQGLDDAIAPPENGHHYVDDHADCASLVELAEAGHAMIVEQPDAVAAAVLTHLRASITT